MSLPFLDLIGIGSINEDLHHRRASQSPRPLAADPETRREIFCDDQELSGLIAFHGRGSFVSRCGGSAFTVIQTAKSLHLNLAVGFVGVAGTLEAQCNFSDALAGVDTTFCHVDPTTLPGRCVAFGSGNNCQLKTADGANAQLLSFLAQRNEELADASAQSSPFIRYLAQAKWIHLTSFVKRGTLAAIVSNIAEAKRLNRLLRVSFDPGDEYAHQPSVEVLDACAIADYLFVNRREFWNLSQAAARDRSLGEAAERLYSHTTTAGQVVVLKHAGSNYVIHKALDKIYLRRYWHHWLPGLFVADDIGAGDVFAGGFIAAHLVPVFKGFGRGPTALGARLAWAKLRRTGIPFDKLGAVALDTADRTLRERDNLRDFVGTWLPTVARYVGAAVVGAIISEVLQRLF